MTARLRLLPLLAAVFLLTGCARWEDYSSKEGRYSVKFPGKVKTETRSLPTPLGTLTMSAALTESKDDAFMVAYADLPRAAFDYKAAVQGMVNTWSGKVLYEKPVTIDGHEGYEFEAEITKPAKGYAAGRLFLHGKRIYQVVALGSKTRADSSKVQKFWDSFKIEK